MKVTRLGYSVSAGNYYKHAVTTINYRTGIRWFVLEKQYRNTHIVMEISHYLKINKNCLQKAYTTLIVHRTALAMSVNISYYNLQDAHPVRSVMTK